MCRPALENQLSRKGENNHAKEQYDYLKTIHDVYPVNFKEAYAFAAIPARYLLENKMWKEASGIEIYPNNFPWRNFPWQKSIVYFARLLGAVHIGNINSAKTELTNLRKMHDTLVAQKDLYKANQVNVQINTSEAWILFKEGKDDKALKTMIAAADMEDKTTKHPVTPGEVIPAAELLGDMLMKMNKPGQALEAYEADLKKHPKRFNGLYGAALAAEKLNNAEKANFYYQQLANIANATDSSRPELKAARLYLKKQVIKKSLVVSL